MEPAMTEAETLAAIEVGMELVRRFKAEGYSLLATGEMGIGNTTTSSAVAAALSGCAVEEITGRGAGLSDAGLLRKRQVIAEALQKYDFGKNETFRILSTVADWTLRGLPVCLSAARFIRSRWFWTALSARWQHLWRSGWFREPAPI